MPKPIPLPAVIVEEGDTLGAIAQRELGRANLWPILAAANHLGDPDVLQPGDIIVIGGVRPLPFMPRHDAFKRRDLCWG